MDRVEFAVGVGAAVGARLTAWTVGATVAGATAADPPHAQMAPATAEIPTARAQPVLVAANGLPLCLLSNGRALLSRGWRKEERRSG
jgi:hypothetical protein